MDSLFERMKEMEAHEGFDFWVSSAEDTEAARETVYNLAVALRAQYPAMTDDDAIDEACCHLEDSHA